MITRSAILLWVLGLFPQGLSAGVSLWSNKLHNNSYTVAVSPHNPYAAYAQGGDGLLYVTRNLGNSWMPLGNPGLAQVRQIIIHPYDSTTLFCAAYSGGLRKSTDQGVTWRTVLPGYGIDGESIAVDESHPDTIYAGNFSNGNIYRTTDRGETWALQGTVGSSLCGLSARPDSANILYAGTGGGSISRSEDGGVSWVQTKPNGSQEIPKIVIDPKNPLIAYATGFAGLSSTTGIWKTIDGGRHWSLTTLKASLWAAVVNPEQTATVWGGTFGVRPAQIFRTTDTGSTWDTLSQGLPSDANAWSLKIHPRNPAALWLAITSSDANARGIYRWVTSTASVEGAVTDAATGDTVRSGTATLLETGENVDLAASSGRFTFRYFDGDSTLTPSLKIVAFPYHTEEVRLQFIPDSSVIRDIPLQRLALSSIAGTVSDSITHMPIPARVRLTADFAGVPVTVEDSTDATGHFVFDSLYISEGAVVGYRSIEVVPDFPHAHAVEHLPELTTPGLTIPVELDTASVLLVQASGGTDYSAYFGSSLDAASVTYTLWDQQEHGTAPFLRARSLRAKTVMYYSGAMTGETPGPELDSLAAAVHAGVHLFVTGQNFVEANDTSSFVKDILRVHFESNVNAFALIAGTPGDLLDGLSISTLDGSGANNQNSRDKLAIAGTGPLSICTYSNGGNAGVRLPSISGDGRIVVFGFGFESINDSTMRNEVLARVMKYCSTGVVLGVHPEPQISPQSFLLGQNYPNPFNPVTRIEYTVGVASGQWAVAGMVRLSVYDLLGREVAVLVNEPKAPGRYLVTFDGAGLSSGVYFYRLVSEGHVLVRSCTLLR